MDHYIPWTLDVVLVACKTYAGLDAERWINISGWPNGYFEQPHERRIQAKVCDEIEGAGDTIKRYYHGAHTIGYLLCHRGRNCLSKEIAPGGNNELAALRRAGLRPFNDMVADHFRTSRKITMEDLFIAREQVIILQVIDKVGVYLRVSPHNPGLFYFGKAEDDTIANRDHLNSPLCLVIGWIINVKSDIPKVERGVIQRLEALGARRYRPDRKTRGLYILDNLDPLATVSQIMRDSYRGWYHGVADMTAAYNSVSDVD